MRYKLMQQMLSEWLLYSNPNAVQSNTINTKSMVAIQQSECSKSKCSKYEMNTLNGITFGRNKSENRVRKFGVRRLFRPKVLPSEGFSVRRFSHPKVIPSGNSAFGSYYVQDTFSNNYYGRTQFLLHFLPAANTL